MLRTFYQRVLKHISDTCDHGRSCVFADLNDRVTTQALQFLDSLEAPKTASISQRKRSYGDILDWLATNRSWAFAGRSKCLIHDRLCPVHPAMKKACSDTPSPKRARVASGVSRLRSRLRQTSVRVDAPFLSGRDGVRVRLGLRRAAAMAAPTRRESWQAHWSGSLRAGSMAKEPLFLGKPSKSSTPSTPSRSCFPELLRQVLRPRVLRAPGVCGLGRGVSRRGVRLCGWPACTGGLDKRFLLAYAEDVFDDCFVAGVYFATLLLFRGLRYVDESEAAFCMEFLQALMGTRVVFRGVRSRVRCA